LRTSVFSGFKVISGGIAKVVERDSCSGTAQVGEEVIKGLTFQHNRVSLRLGPIILNAKLGAMIIEDY
jgi:hypothetical protein